MRVLAADIGGTAIKAGICDENGGISEVREFQSHAKRGGPFLMENLYAILARYEGFERIGLSVTGQVDSERGCIVFADDNVPNFTGTPIAALVRERFAVPVAVENDVNAAAIGEARFGAGREYRDFLCLTYGTGIGGALILNGALYKGAQGIAGEAGHMITHANGLLCTCGNRGCYEQYASASALVRRAQAKDEALTDGRLIFRREQQGDAEIAALVAEWIGEIAAGLVSLIHMLNPEAILMGGGIMEASGLVQRISDETHRRLMDSFRHTQLRQAGLGNRAGLMGAAWLAVCGAK